MDRDEHIQYFDLHQEAVTFLLVVVAAKDNSQVLQIQGI